MMTMLLMIMVAVVRMMMAMIMMIIFKLTQQKDTSGHCITVEDNEGWLG